MAEQIYPLRFEPVYKDYIWGGDRIVRTYNRGRPPGIYAESWEVSDREDGMSVVSNGPLKGSTLRDLEQRMGSRLLGAKAARPAFPLLVKLIDSRDRLSVQVHPNDATAARHGGEAKTEMWYVLDADPGAGVFAGLKPGVDEHAFDEAVRTKQFRDILSFVPVKKGDAIFVPGGRVHAIDTGCLLLEVQQNSNTTYRIYDWDRVGPDGKPRALHLDEARRVILWDDRASPKVAPRELPAIGRNRRWEILRTPYFVLDRVEVTEALDAGGDGSTFQVLFVAGGSARILSPGFEETLAAGTSCLIPAALSACWLEPEGGPAEVLRATLP